MSSQNPKRLLFAHFAALARVLGNEHRLELLELLAQGEQSVERLTARTGLGFANVSQHLQHLRKGWPGDWAPGRQEHLLSPAGGADHGGHQRCETWLSTMSVPSAG